MSFRLIDNETDDPEYVKNGYTIIFDKNIIFDDLTLDCPLNEDDNNLFELCIDDQSLSIGIRLTVDAHKLIKRLQDSLNNKYYMRGYKQAIENMKKEKEN